VVPTAGAALTEPDLRAQLRELLAGYKVPSRILFASEAELPLTGTGKPVIDGVRSLVAARIECTQPRGEEGS
jgi:acyl-CoA synthetase (AMP-forming)/AMP-acid ligase II